MSQNQKTRIRILANINGGYKILVIMRGLPGSGKSTMAKKIIQTSINQDPSQFIFSADDFFYRNGQYQYDPSKISDAHEWNQARVLKAVKCGISPVIVDNTHLEIWEMQVYSNYAVNHGYFLETLESDTPWALNAGQLGRKNTHGVPPQKIKILLQKYQKNVSGSDLISMFKLNYKPGLKPPITRDFPPAIIFGNITNKVGLKNKSEDSLPNAITNHNNNVPKLTIHNNLTVPENKSGNLIDLMMDETPAESCNGLLNHKVSKNDTSSTSGVDNQETPWIGVWDSDDNPAFQNKHSKITPKPQRVPDTIMHPDLPKNQQSGFDFINWEPIDVSVSNWVKDTAHCNNKQQNNTSSVQNPIFKLDVSTMTQRSGEPFTENKVLIGRNKEINSSYTPKLPVKVAVKPTLDKSVMTNDDLFENQENNPSNEEMLKNFSSLFSHVPQKVMKDILEKCKGDVNWMAELILDGNNESDFINLVDDSDSDSDDVVETKMDEDVDSYIHVEKMDLTTNDKPVIENHKSNKTPKKDRILTDDSKKIIKQIKDNFKFSEDHYTEHHLKVKKILRHEKSPEAPLKPENCNEPFEFINHREEKISSGSDEENEKLVQFRMGKEFFDQLNDLYGMSYVSHENLDPVINMPKSLANQIYALWLESICNQIEQSNALREEDEEFARQLQAQENKCSTMDDDNDNVPNFQEIMNMEMSFALTYANDDYVHEEDLATKLTQLKLIEMFPEIDKDVIIEIYKAHNNNFEHTFEGLLLSTGKISAQASNIDKKTLKAYYYQQEKILVEKAKKKKEEVVNNIKDTEMGISDYSKVEDLEVLKESVQELRKYAQKHMALRNENHDKAKEYSAKGMTQVAMYYSEIAATHTKKYEQANSYAASRIMQLNISGENNCTLDLHTLFVAEALQILDVFIDNHISKLRDKKSNFNESVTVYVITGRGKHSPGNRPRIKPAVLNRLQHRKLKSLEVNPGLLGVYVTARDQLSGDSKDHQEASTSQMWN